jgi:hypothetical protein
MHNTLEWLFRDSRSGRIVVGQWPNLPLLIFAGAVAAEWLLAPAGLLGAGLRALQLGSLVWWAADELLRGVNPWRRGLGAATLGFVALRLLWAGGVAT